MRLVAAAFLVLFGLPLLTQADDVGVFADQKDIGVLLHAGSSLFDLQSRIYTLYASGENMWAAKDAFHFRFTKASGDLSLSADISFLEAGTDKHRKACLMFRQSLDADSAYIDVALHGDGLTSLQFRESKGALTHEIQSSIQKPRRLRLEKRASALGSRSERLLRVKRERLDRLRLQLEERSPLRVLERGYSIAIDAAGNVLRSSEQVAVGDILGIQLARGRLTTEVKKKD